MQQRKSYAKTFIFQWWAGTSIAYARRVALNFLALTLIYFVGLLHYDALWCSIVLSKGEI
jgi:hypothetical protein